VATIVILVAAVSTAPMGVTTPCTGNKST